MTLPMSVPAHSSLMQPAPETLRIRWPGTRGGALRGVKVYGVDCRITPPGVDTERPGQAIIDAGVLGGDGSHHDFRGRDANHRVRPGRVLTGADRRVDKKSGS